MSDTIQRALVGERIYLTGGGNKPRQWSGQAGVVSLGLLLWMGLAALVYGGFGPTITRITPSGNRGSANVATWPLVALPMARISGPNGIVRAVSVTPYWPPTRASGDIVSARRVPLKASCVSVSGIGIGTGAGVHPAKCNAPAIRVLRSYTSWSPGTYQRTTFDLGASLSSATKASVSKVIDLGSAFRRSAASSISAFAARSCCSASSVLADASAVSSATSLSVWRALMRLLVQSAPAPKTKVTATSSTDPHWKTEFQNSTLIDKIFLIATPILALVVLVFGVTVAILGWRNSRQNRW
jgi:hypothetical protein